jgi:hypothetical protein
MQVLGTGKHMDVATWTPLLQDVELWKTTTPETLVQLVEDYPWMGEAHVVLALVEHHQNLPQAAMHLKHSALRVSQRERLYQLWHTSSESTLQLAKTEELPTETAPHPQEIPIGFSDAFPIQLLAEQILEEEPKPLIWEGPMEIAIPEWTFSEKVIALENATETTEITLENPPQQPEVNTQPFGLKNELENPPALAENHETPDLGILGFEILNKAISSSIEMEVGEEETEEEEQEDSHETQVSVAPVVDPGMDFLAFLSHVHSEGPPPATEESGTLPAAPVKKESLIDRFIQEEPQITRGRAVEYSSGNLAKESLEENFNLVTETMAKLYIKQGKIDKARKAYRKLMELFPEKSIYFANQLKNLNKKNL